MAGHILKSLYVLESVGYFQGTGVIWVRTESQTPCLPCRQPVGKSSSRTFQGRKTDP